MGAYQCYTLPSKEHPRRYRELALLSKGLGLAEVWGLCLPQPVSAIWF